LSKILFERCSALSGQVEKSGGDGVEFVFGESIDNIQQQGASPNETKRGIESNVRVRFARSQQWRAFDFVVGADGLQSKTRMLAWTTVHDEPKEEVAKQPQSTIEEEFTTDDSLRRGAPFKGGREAITSESTNKECQPSNTDQSSILPSPQTSLKAKADPHLRPLGVYNAFFSIPSSLLSRSSGQASRIKNVSKGTNNNDNVNDGWRRWYHVPGRKSVMLRPSDDSTRLTVLMIVLDLERSDSRLESVATAKDDRKTALIKQKELMREYFEDSGWECVKLVEGMQAANDFYYDLVAQVKMEQWSKGRVCLLGDAAYVYHLPSHQLPSCV
jgi:2-polyprenyl-6-methoxyphenol hydroxylase-like FAD-dependent oxidoreductase